VSDLITNAALIPPETAGSVDATQTRTASGTTTAASSGVASSGVDQAPESFATVLAQEQSPSLPTFSKHALERLQQRGIDMDSSTLSRLADGIGRAAEKGSRNSVVFVDGMAFLTSVSNNTVITALTPERMKSHVFTNIDSAVVA
jgi:flagellar operon protein